MSYIELADNTPHHYDRDEFNLSPSTIAKHLSHINRYNGAVGQYSVAQHSVLVARLLPKSLQLSGLLHDAQEAVLGDMAAPLKQFVPEFKSMEGRLQDAIDKRFDVQTRHDSVKEADMRMLVTEAKAFGLNFWQDYPEYTPAMTDIKRWPPQTAANMWLNTFYELRGRA